ncbi:hypothetical protein NEFER03_1032 [Nematocida sp. LUAm3]|nr:hypothetical protein NEFER03_1032 [Nematocida sp. LUAm3]KAI5177679.1 hypothetical protein NEFER01_0903 [Nematocida sp. LUAm1]
MSNSSKINKEQIDYSKYYFLLEEEEKVHPNVDEKTFLQWRERRREEAKEELRERQRKIHEKKNTSQEEEKELQKISELLREKIVEVSSTTHLAKEVESSLEFIISDPPESIKETAEEIVELLSTSANTLEYLHSSIKHKDSNRDALAEYLLIILQHNIKSDCPLAAKRISKYIIAYEYSTLSAVETITEGLLFGIEKEGAEYYQRVLEYIQQNTPSPQ